MLCHLMYFNALIIFYRSTDWDSANFYHQPIKIQRTHVIYWKKVLAESVVESNGGKMLTTYHVCIPVIV